MDYESETSVNFTISASDGRNSTTAEVYVNVVPVNEFPPVIHWSDVDIDVTENTNVTFQFNVSAHHVPLEVVAVMQLLLETER